MRGTIGEIVTPGGIDLSLKVLDESVAVASACGHKLSEAFLAQNAGAMTAPGSPLTSSMYRDLRKGALVEVDHILGDFIERGGAHGVATPLLKAAFANLSEQAPEALRGTGITIGNVSQNEAASFCLLP